MNKSGYKIAVDLDGTSYMFTKAIRDYIFNTTDRPIEDMADPQVWNFFSEQWGYTVEEYLKFVSSGVTDNFIFWKGDMYPDCKKVLDYLYTVRGDEIIIVTSRAIKGVENLCASATEAWLLENDIPYDRLILTEDKTSVDFDLLIDDAPHQIEDAIVAGKTAIIYDQPWNRAIGYPPRAHGWMEVLAFIEKRFPVGTKKFSQMG